jgi:cation diffusion facilitator CzcD-associated flavoprotein CzcO
VPEPSETTQARPLAAPHVDVVVVGAGLSGIGAAYRLQTECPGRTYAVLEARAAIGGTWDLFRYPGIRSDSDFFTLSYPFRPWSGRGSIVEGEEIRRYVADTAREHGIDRHIRFQTLVVAAAWSSEEGRWTLTLQETGPDGATRESTLTCSFLYACAGYYDYERAHQPEFPGLADFAGTVVVPQFWPEGLDVTGRRVVVIGSGATAVTLAPALASTAGHVTVLQRSPTWIGAVPGEDALANRLRRVLPARLAHHVIRVKNILRQQAVYAFCTRWPVLARRLLLGLTAKQVDPALVEAHFTPAYDPWEQRFCVAPDGDFFRAIRRGQVEVVTDHVDRFLPAGIRLAGGRVLEADVVVTATGLEMVPFGGVRLSVDGEPVELHDRFVWQGAMLTGVPNFAVAVGYVNASWTLRADLTSRLVCKVLNEMDRRSAASVVPVPDRGLRPQPLLPLSSGYIQRALGQFPQQGDRGPWRVRQNYLLDAALTLRRDLGRTLRFEPARVAPSVRATEPAAGRGR